MTILNHHRQVYQAPFSIGWEVLIEQNLLAESTRALLYLDELENVNATAGQENEGDFYFDIYEF